MYGLCHCVISCVNVRSVSLCDQMYQCAVCVTVSVQTAL
jgi:hypothetical protein